MMNSIQERPLLTRAEEKTLGERIAQGDRDARNILVECNLRLVQKICMRYFVRDNAVTFEDLFQEGVIGLMSAADRFDPTRGLKFSTYATYRVRHAVRKAALTAGTIKRATDHDRQCVRPNAIQRNRIRNAGMAYLDAPVHGLENTTLMDVLPNKTASLEDEVLAKVEADRILGQLIPRHQKLLRHWMSSDLSRADICQLHGRSHTMLYQILITIRAREAKRDAKFDRD